MPEEAEVRPETMAFLPAFIPVFVLVGFFVLAALWIARRAKLRELVHRERMAMIEKGMVPPAELFPGAPPASILESAAYRGNTAALPPSLAASRFRSIGIMLVGLGAALVLIIGVAAGEPDIGLGIGGAIATVGAAMIVNAVVSGRERPAPPAGSPLPNRESLLGGQGSGPEPS